MLIFRVNLCVNRVIMCNDESHPYLCWFSLLIDCKKVKLAVVDVKAS